MTEQMFNGGDADFAMWDDTAAEINSEGVVAMRSLSQAAVEPLWPYLSAASTRVEFEHRMGMVEDGIAARVAAVLGDDWVAVDEARRHLIERWSSVDLDRTANALRSATAGLVLAGDGQTAQVMAFPQCDICKQAEAHYDGKTVFGPWAYMCDSCFKTNGVGLGLGQGQKLVLAPSSKEGALDKSQLGQRVVIKTGPHAGESGVADGVISADGHTTTQYAITLDSGQRVLNVSPGADFDWSGKTSSLKDLDDGALEAEYRRVVEQQNNTRIPEAQEALRDWRKQVEQEQARRKTSAKTAASHYIEYNEHGGIKHAIPAYEFEQMVKSPQNGWKTEKQDDGSYWATGPEGTGHRYVPWTSGGPAGGDQSKRGVKIADSNAKPWTPAGGNDSDPNYFMQNEFGGKDGTSTVDGVTVHTFASTGQAYNESQVSDDIKDGDILSVPSEGVVGFLYEAWPVAVTSAHGEFHGITDEAGFLADNPKYAHAMQVAKGLAKTGSKTGAFGAGTFEIRNGLQGFLESEIGAMTFPEKARMALTIDGRVYTLSLVLDTATGDDGNPVHGDVSGYYAVWVNKRGETKDLGGNLYISPGKAGGPQQAYAARNAAERIMNDAKWLIPEGTESYSHTFNVTVTLTRDPYFTASLHTAETNPPYYIEEKDGKFVVVNDEGKVKGTFDTKDEARQQQKALYANVPGASEEAERQHGNPKPKVQSAVQALLRAEGYGQHTPDDDEGRRRQEQEDYDDEWRSQPGAIQSSRLATYEDPDEEAGYTCPRCGGTGLEPGGPMMEYMRCTECGGLGVIPYGQPMTQQDAFDQQHMHSSRRQAGVLDRSVIFTALLDVMPSFGQMTMHEGSEVVSRCLADWDKAAAAGATDMYAFCKDWAAAEEATHGPRNTPMASLTADYKYVHQRGNKWVITQKGTGKVLSEHDSQEKAEAAFRAMMQSKHGAVYDLLRAEAVNDAGEGSDRYQHVDPPGVPPWTTHWEDDIMFATPEMTEQGMNAYVKPNPLPNLTTLQQVRSAALRTAAEEDVVAEKEEIPEDDEGGFSGVGIEPQTDQNAATGDTQPKTTKPAQVPGQDDGPHMVTIDTQIIPPDPQPMMGEGQSTPEMGSGGGFDMGYAPTQDPMLPTTEQMVAAKVARLTERIELDNPSMSHEAARHLAAMTIAKHPEMVKVQR